MLVIYNRKRGTPLTPEQLAEIEEARKHPIVFDEDCPEMTDEQLRQFRRAKRSGGPCDTKAASH